MSDVVTRLIDKVENRYYGKYRATVADNNDPKNLGRLRVYVPELLGEKNKTGWALPCLPYGGLNDTGFFFIPEINSNVWIEFEGGNLSYPIWTGTWWSESENTSPKEIKNNKNNSIKILKTRSGHKIEINDDKNDDNAGILIATSDGKRIFLHSSSNNKKIEISSEKGNKLILDDTNDQISIQSSKGNQLEIKNTGSGIIIIKTSSGDSIEMDSNSKSITISTNGKITLKSSEISLEATANLNIKSGGTLNLEGAIINLN